ncbi:MAG: type II secretion system protein [Planctomycetota bacterium]|nr:type II secretion system protein [Planctomycetota bacterium]
MRQQLRFRTKGMTILEVMVTVLVLAIAITAALMTFATHFRGARLTEERRIAMQFAQAKIDDIRLAVATGDTLERIFQKYGPLDYNAISGTTTGGTSSGELTVGLEGHLNYTGSTGTLTIPVKGTTGAVTYMDPEGNGYVLIPDGMGGHYGDPATFIVGEDKNNNGYLESEEDLNANGNKDVYLAQLPGMPMGSVTVITSETPNEADFGRVYGKLPNTTSTNWYERNPFGVDITGNRTYSDALPSPFPLDLNGDGDSNDTTDVGADRRDDVVVDGFYYLPVVVTIVWASPYGPERMDVFGIIAKENP